MELVAGAEPQLVHFLLEGTFRHGVSFPTSLSVTLRCRRAATASKGDGRASRREPTCLQLEMPISGKPEIGGRSSFEGRFAATSG
jgi:hypothetical protein